MKKIEPWDERKRESWWLSVFALNHLPGNVFFPGKHMESHIIALTAKVQSKLDDGLAHLKRTEVSASTFNNRSVSLG